MVGRTAEFLPLIPDGIYEVAFDGYETAIQFRDAPKVILNFHIVSIGQYFETKLARYYTVAALKGKPRAKGKFKVKGQTSIFLIEFLNCHPDREIPRRLDQVPMGCWGRTTYQARVASVSHNSSQKKLPKQLQYSKIKELLCPA